MRNLAVLSFVLFGPLLAQSPLKQFGLFLSFEEPPAPDLRAHIEAEVEELLKPAGLRPVWRLLSESDGSEQFRAVIIVKFLGRCRPLWSGPDPVPEFEPFARGIRLGSTRITEGRIAPWVQIECDTLRQGVAGFPLRKQADLFDRAIGRVLAHELWHYLLKTKTHDKTGLAKAGLSWEELVSGRTAFSPAALSQLSDSLR